MINGLLQPDVPPLRSEADGSLRIGESRVLLELVIRAFKDGATPEAIVQRFSTLPLSHVYAVIAHYLRHQQAVEEYLARREREGDESQRTIESANDDLAEIRSRLNTRRKAS